MKIKKKRKGGGGAAKGSAYERELCKRISFWFSGGETEDLFWRTAGSGSRATNRRRLGHSPSKYDYGDMKHEVEEGRILVEHLCWEFRSRARFDVYTTFGDGSEDPNISLLSSWAKVSEEAACSGRRPILITKMLRRPEVIWIPHGLYTDLLAHDDSALKVAQVALRVPPMTVKFDKGKSFTFHDSQRVMGLPLIDWFFGMDPEVFVEYVRAFTCK